MCMDALMNICRYLQQGRPKKGEFTGSVDVEGIEDFPLGLLRQLAESLEIRWHEAALHQSALFLGHECCYTRVYRHVVGMHHGTFLKALTETIPTH